MKVYPGFILLLVSLFFLVNSESDITGAVIGTQILSSATNFIFGAVFLLFSGLLFLVGLEKKIELTSRIKQFPAVRGLAEAATRNREVQKDLDHLTHELSRGHLEAGIGNLGHVRGTDIHYMRGRKGGRLYFRKIEGGYEIVAKSGKGVNQERVIKKLGELYKH